MKLIKPKVEILDRFKRQQVIGRIATVARTCYKSEAMRTADRDEALVKRLIESKHEAMLEFVDVTVKFTCDRGVSHELVRHRMASFAQESTRYCNYSKDKFNNELTFIIPSWLDWKEETIHKGDFEKSGSGSIDSQIFINNLLDAEDAYLGLIKEGWTAEKARMVLPMSIKTEINMKANLREWRHFFKLRCHHTAHPDIRVLALDLLKQMHEQIPVIFDDLYDTYFNNGDKRSFYRTISKITYSNQNRRE